LHFALLCLISLYKYTRTFSLVHFYILHFSLPFLLLLSQTQNNPEERERYHS
jgi:hypothetical protein